MPEKFLKPYDSAATEGRIYEAWETSGLFNPDECVKQSVTEADAPPYSIVLPPPNVTGRLHMGHALMLAIEDIFIRYKRMRGFRTLWVPGTDHAAIATQSVVEKQVKKDEGLNRHDLGREGLLKRIHAFAAESHDTIVSQLKVMGASLDWSREAFTLDETRTRAVNKVFKMMYDAGLIYRGLRIVNWDPKGQTTISDDEIVYEERPAKLYTFRYSKDFPIPVATTRPETKVGDVGVAVHPDDARYKAFVGKEYDAVFCDVPIHIKIVADKEVDPVFGTGAVGLTPAHSHTDWEVADRHLLSHEVIVINEYAKMTVAGRLKDKKTTEAREIVVEWLTSEGLLEKEEDITQNVATAERTGGIIEPLPKLQWFIEVNKQVPGRNKTLKELVTEPVRTSAIKIIPDYFEKTYFHWVENLRDWCISRQIWYGHRIPVWYKGEDISVGIEPKEDGWTQDEDTLDTWFSSGLWTFSTLGWPEQTNDFKTYHPTDVLETGYDILPFWVMRMILMTEFTLGAIPFKTVYLHGLVRDAQGRKMTKSLGNVLNPVDVAAKFGADATRMALVVGNTPGTDMRISEDKVKGYKHFANKLWNIARFVLSQERTGEPIPKLKDEFDTLARDVTNDLENYRMYLVAEKLYHYIWSRFAAEIIEESKGKPEYRETLHYILENALKLLHPFMPFITEEIYQSLPTKDAKFLMVAKWPA
ncbi:valine--tRNA ligase [Candidatus Kaiserbacteria bacterium RIFCSPLOWO2_02_FULL_54_13]|uniref:Valine--tRNA ligase n=1 Tax=Candidatus Kaiserbacteria bacterium RIFCSPHIGHO2_02_FULL_54_22 TaxID=1798495 RepID=A0A1F6DLT9_9BACT|nr:MAG: valyl-tRNA synthetase [Parcubacteria group bacterium GW2011_GWB1_55_9]OGG62374.1 MAG: valine--tRNA ligase [Candidatus Kaiserbacteria bacterium RIFCSPHIGHO2_02_FULL_54_22]OGG67842.1 MAG: valine--tRNA ligase [Candidatus Kaiserbacteria bacterium RIFCSPHIGHO2_12_FULL_54_16]OGG83132.1 MAG: valine--tRNA ligase [Candidatus Kaiserbacteria bacterium RIFCSPLOWO2_02_FULL_54_13]